jgi:ribosomal protein S18 acetylase RimI-like enzyme
VNVRRPTPDDLSEVLALCGAADTAVWGATDWTEGDLRSEWEELDLANDAWLVELDGRLAGYGTFADRGEGRLMGDGYVHPELQGRGVGSRLLDLYERRAAELSGGSTLESAALRGDGAADRLFSGRGYEPVRHFFRMVADLDGALEPPAWPDGLEVGRLDVEREGRAAYDAIVEAFAEEWGFQIRPWEEFREWRFGAGRFDPTLCPVVTDGDEIAAVSLNDWKTNGDWGWVDLLAVRPAWRRRRLGEALLRETFREFRSRGERQVALAVDAQNPTGATRLYERVGMRRLWEAVLYRKELQ